MYANLQAQIASTPEYYTSYGMSYANHCTHYLLLPIILGGCLLTGDLQTYQLYIKKEIKRNLKTIDPSA